MKCSAEFRADYLVEVSPSSEGSSWSVLRAGDRAMSGHAPDGRSAYHRGAFAAAALAAFDRIRRRRF